VEGAEDKKEALPEDKKEALRSFIDLGKQHITLAAGVVAVTATFIKQITGDDGRSDAPLELLVAGWSSLFLSILFGLLLHGRGVALMAESNYDPDDRLLSRLGQIQQVTFLLGIALLLIYVGLSL
jgi:aspartate/methionine/tyrosine aminotransferase